MFSATKARSMTTCVETGCPATSGCRGSEANASDESCLKTLRIVQMPQYVQFSKVCHIPRSGYSGPQFTHIAVGSDRAPPKSRREM